MRRLLVPATLFLALVACSPATSGPAQTLALEQMATGVGLDVTAARQTVVDFLNGYVNASRDRAVALARTVGNPKLIRWIYWLNVQNASFPGRISGKVDVGSLDFVGATPTQTTLLAQIDLTATVTFSYVLGQGTQLPPVVRQLDGPVTLAKRGPGDWEILDLTRDGQSMADSIYPFAHAVQTRQGITVRLDSLFTFPPFWSFNLIVADRSGEALTIDPAEATISARGAGSTRTTGKGITPPLHSIPAGRSVDGSMNFPAPPTPVGDVLSIAVRVGERVVTFGFRLPAIVSSVPSPTASASAS